MSGDFPGFVCLLCLCHCLCLSPTALTSVLLCRLWLLCPCRAFPSTLTKPEESPDINREEHEGQIHANPHQKDNKRDLRSARTGSGYARGRARHRGEARAQARPEARGGARKVLHRDTIPQLPRRGMAGILEAGGADPERSEHAARAPRP